MICCFGLCPAQQYNFIQYSISEGLPHAKVNHLLADSTGYIWLASENGGASRFDGVDFENFSMKQGLSSNQITGFKIDQNNLFVQTDKGIDIWQNNRFVSIDSTDIINTIFDVNPTNSYNQTLKFGQCYTELPDGKVWLGDRSKGIIIYNTKDSSSSKINEALGLPSNQIYDITHDLWGNVWIASSAGLIKYLGETFTHFDRRNGLHGKRVSAIEEDHDGIIWVAASNEGIATFDGHKFTKMTRDQGYLDLKTFVLYETSDREMWVGTNGGGLLVFDENRYSIVTIKDGLPSSWINDIIEDDNGHIWMATPASGIAKIVRDTINNYQIVEFNKSNGLPDNYITTIEKNSTGDILFATSYGRIGIIKDDTVTTIFSSNHGLPGSPIRCLASQNNKLYAGTEGRGIYVANFNDTIVGFKKLESKNINSSTINILKFDSYGQLWAGTDRGVNKINLQSATPYDVVKYGKNEGFLGVQTNKNAVLLDRNNNLWFGTTNGITRHKPTNQSIIELPPKLHFKDITLFYKSLSETEYASALANDGGLNKTLELPYHKNHLSFDFKGIHQNYAQSIQYQWKLEGAEDDWSPLSKKSSVNYTNLPAGEYTFKAKAYAENNLSALPISASFVIKKPIWQITWVKLLALGILLISIIGISYWRIKAIKRREKIKRRQLEMDNHILQLEQKALQLQMNPHFIFNALNSIQSLVATNQYDNARQQINNFAVLMRSILSNSKQETITLEEEVNTLTAYLTVEQFCQPTPFDFKISTNGLSTEETVIPPMLVQPFVENAVIHGISHLKNRKGNIIVDFSQKNDLLVCTIEDNGVGRTISKQLNQSKKPGHQSIAMEVTKERLQTLKGKLKYSPFVLEDLKNNQEDSGTKIVMQLPFDNGF